MATNTAAEQGGGAAAAAAAARRPRNSGEIKVGVDERTKQTLVRVSERTGIPQARLTSIGVAHVASLSPEQLLKAAAKVGPRSTK